MTTTTTEMMTTTMTDRPRRRLPLRWWIVGWIALTAGIGIGLLLTLTIVLMRRDVGERANAQITQEIAEFQAQATTGAESDGEALLQSFLQGQRPGDGELLLGYIAHSGTYYVNSGAQIPAREDYDPTADAGLMRQILNATTGTAQTPAGEVRWGRSDVADADGRSSMIVLVFTEAEHRQVSDTAQLLLTIGALSLVLTGAIAWWVSGRVLRPVAEVREAAAEIGERDLTRRLPVDGTDELADLALTFNAMLERLEQAFATQQQFVDDAGHELRTPITIIRGHLELMGDDPADRAATIEIVTGELDRMNRMVTDLLTLAKSERPDYIRLREPVDIAELTMELDAKLQGLADRRWLVGSVADGEAIIDAQRISQAILQLATNATQHTAAGSTITLSSAFHTAADGSEQLVLTVADEGSGVPEADVHRIFERFGRPATEAASPGAGLGLAIVKSIAEGHGGTVHVQGTPGGGATFVIAVPTRIKAPQRGLSDEPSADS
ncbi:sensor histidine kinase [Cumulibacter soli]|uniref:sensor histidine kinase n=1 Tax=Cumulibacter soli TaxID=2546344 RepID=UPI00141A17DD|nr:ATP-binding protein [Cumulibacter soli]